MGSDCIWIRQDFRLLFGFLAVLCRRDERLRRGAETVCRFSCRSVARSRFFGSSGPRRTEGRGGLMFLSEEAALQTDSGISAAFGLKQGFYYESVTGTEDPFLHPLSFKDVLTQRLLVNYHVTQCETRAGGRRGRRRTFIRRRSEELRC